ncbi:MAG: PD40 domain-containing protein, partial [Bacteroidetes bacterium]|nr:PD40 domain-containing protein [Bacteroidota bacterium]
MPDDTNKYVLFHQTGNYSSLPSSLSSTEIYYSVIDISLNGGLGEVISKNNIALTGLFGWGLSACKHGNGRDWWVIALNENATIAYKFLITPDTIYFVNSQTLSNATSWGYAGQPLFSPDGEKFAFGGSYGFNGTNYLSRVSLFDFDRCSGLFSLDTVIDFSDNYISYATAFSPNSKYLYFATTENLYQIDVDTSDIGSTFQLVATNDIFLSAPPVFYTNFYLMYLAANGKIYITSGSSVLDLHEMDYPDSAGIACTVNLHNIHTNCFFIGVPNHPNYYLGRLVGSACDSLTSVNEPEHDFKFKIFPNPNNGNFKIMYLLPQNEKGKLEIFDINGRAVYSQN